MISIIIPTYRDWLRLQVCLEALNNQSYSNSDFEVIVVNNDPSDPIPKSFQVYDNVRIISEVKPGSYAARNAALKIAEGEIIGFTDSDCIPDPYWIENAIKIFESNEEIDRIAGYIEIFRNSKKKVELYDVVYAFPQKIYSDSGFGVTGNMFSRKKVFSDIGFFDADVKSGGDSRWGWRAKEAGYNITYSDNVIVKHPARNSLKELRNKAKRVGKGMRNFKANKSLNKFKFFKYMLITSMPSKRRYNEIRNRLSNDSFISVLYVVVLSGYLDFIKNYEIFRK